MVDAASRLRAVLVSMTDKQIDKQTDKLAGEKKKNNLSVRELLSLQSMVVSFYGSKIPL